MKKRFISTSLIFILCTTALFGCSCLSTEQQQIAKENESVSKTIAEEYLKSNYDGGTVNSLNCITYTPKESALGSRKASSYVRASATANDKNFYILVNTESKECLDNYNAEDVKEIIKQRAAAILPDSEPVDITAEIYPNSVSEDLQGNDYEGYLDVSDKTAEDIFLSGNYSINVTCSYVDDEADFSAIDTSGFLPEDSTLNNVTLSYLNYKNEARFRNGGEDSYKLNDSFVSTFTDSSESPVNEYHSYSSFTNDDVEIAWDTTKIDLQVTKSSDSPEEEIVNEDYQNLIFKPKSNTALEIKYTLLDAADGTGELEFYFDGTNYGDYGILTDKQNIFNPNTIFEINASKSGYTYVPFTFSHSDGTFTLAIYKGEESNDLVDLVNGLGSQK